MAKKNVVTAPLVVTKRADGSDAYLYEGSDFPDGLKDGELKRLTDAGLVGEVDASDDDSEKAPAKKSASSK